MDKNFIWSPTRTYSRAHTFNILFCDLFLLIKNEDVASYAENTTP